MYEAGVQIDWNGFQANGPRLKVTLPTYAFQRERYWLDDRATSTPLAQRPASLAEMAVRFESLAELRSRCSIEAPDALAAARRFVAGATPDGSSGTIERIWRGEAEALGEIRVNAGVSPLRLQAWLFEACAAVAAAALPGGSSDEPGTPSRATFSGTPGPRAWSYVRYRALNADGTGGHLADVAIVGDDGAVIGTLEGLRFARPVSSAADGRWSDDALYKIEWRQAFTTPGSGADARGLGALAPVELIESAMRDETAALAATHGIDGYGKALAHLDALTTAHVVDTFHRLGWRPAAGSTFDADALAADLGIVASQRRLVRRFLEMLEEDGFLRSSAGSWEVLRELPTPDFEVLGEAANHHQSAGYELTLATRCGEQLLRVLKGEVEPLEVLFPGGFNSGAEQVYADSPVARLFNGLVAKVIATIVSQLPADRPLRILEVGGGTGGTTGSILPLLPAARTEYTFTDVSPLFLQRAAEKFAAYPFVEYRLYDVEKSARQQSIPVGGFDLIVAANVLHATRDLRVTVGNIAELLAPEGLVLFGEATRPARWLDLTFGLTDGWWRFEDQELRRHPLLSRSSWVALLSSLGFREPAALPAVGLEADVLDSNALIVARAPVRDERPAGIEGHWLVLADRGELGRGIAGQLSRRGATCVVAVAAAATGPAADGEWTLDPGAADGFDRLLAGIREPLAGVVHCFGLDATPLDRASSASLEHDAVLTCGSLLHLTQALLRAGGPARIWVVTRDAVSAVAGDRVTGTTQAPLWGFGRVVSLEHPELWGGLIDVSGAIVEREHGGGSGRADCFSWRRGPGRASRRRRLRAAIGPGRIDRRHAGCSSQGCVVPGDRRHRRCRTPGRARDGAAGRRPPGAAVAIRVARQKSLAGTA